MARPTLRSSVLLLLLVVCLTLPTASAFSVSPAPDSDPDANGVIVRLAPGSLPPLGATPLYGLLDTYMIPAQPNKRITDQVTEWKSAPAVLSVEPNTRVYVDPVPDEFNEGVQPFAVNDPLVSQQYSLERMSVPTAWNSTRGDGVTVAIVDTGADFTHPDLAGKFVSRGRDFVNNDQDATDDHGHGTHVSGIAAAVVNNGQGIAGIAYNARLLPVKVLSSTGSGDNAAVASGITWAADQGAKVINLSLGGGYPSTTVQAAVDYAWGRGAVVVCAAGNGGVSTPMYPAAYTPCIAVGATDQGDRRTSFSNFGSWVDVAAPGKSVYGPVPGGSYQAWDGTSMAAPNAAGVVALIAAAHPTWTNAQIRAALETGADTLDGQQLGRGRVNAARAVGSGPSPQPSPTGRGSEPTATPVPGDFADQVEQLINAARKAQGLAPLRVDGRLRAAANAHNRFMYEHNCFAHQCPGEEDPVARMKAAGYPALSGGENIGMGYRTPQAMMDGWMNSSGHRAAILNTYWPDLGCAYLAGGNWWSCEFARGSDSGNPLPIPSPTTRGGGPPPTGTPLPRPQPTPVPLPTPTGIPTPPPYLARGYWMTLTVPAYAPTLALWRTRWNLCQPYQGRGVTCTDIIGRPLVAVLDYDLVSPLAPHYAWWWVYEPYKAFGVTITVRKK